MTTIFAEQQPQHRPHPLVKLNRWWREQGHCAWTPKIEVATRLSSVRYAGIARADGSGRRRMMACSVTGK